MTVIALYSQVSFQDGDIYMYINIYIHTYKFIFEIIDTIYILNIYTYKNYIHIILFPSDWSIAMCWFIKANVS